MTPAPPITMQQELPAHLAIAATGGASFEYTQGVDWQVADSSVASVTPRPDDGREAVIRPVGPGTTTLTVTTQISIGGKTEDVRLEGTITVEGSASAGYTAELVWGEPRPLSEQTG